MTKPNYKSKDATELLNYAEHILKKMTENDDLFDQPLPSLTVLDSALSEYREPYAEATHRVMRAVVLKGQRRKALQPAVYRLSHYVDAQAQGDPAILLAAGYKPAKSKLYRAGAPPKPHGV